MTDPKPTLGRIVHYRSKTGDYTLAALITATTESINPKGVETGNVPPLTGDDHVHLAVFTPGLPNIDVPPMTRSRIDPSKPLGQRQMGRHDPDVEGQLAVMVPFGGTYQEFDIPFDAGNTARAGTWMWPPRV